MTPEFKRRLNAERKLFIREERDGCVDCIEQGTCQHHINLFRDLATNPRKYLKIEFRPKEQQS